MTDKLTVFVTVDTMENARQIANVVVKRHLAACCTIVPKVTSIFYWEGELKEETEHLLIMKTRKQVFGLLRDRIREAHPYKVPEIVAVEITDGLDDYLAWISSETGAY